MQSFIMPYKAGSASSRLLSETLGVKRIKSEGSKWVNRDNRWVINWGCSEVPDNVKDAKFLNLPSRVALASNKLDAFEAMKERRVSMPEFTADKAVAQDWVDEGELVVARTKLRGHSGEGIVLVANEEYVQRVEDQDMERFDRVVSDITSTLPDAPLYTKYVKKVAEYRVHIFRNEVIDMQRKARKESTPLEDVNWRIRNLDGGFIYKREDVEIGNNGLSVAKSAMRALGLDFGAVDLIWNESNNRYYVLEVNTAPGLSGTTLEKYTEAFRKAMREFDEGVDAPLTEEDFVNKPQGDPRVEAYRAKHGDSDALRAIEEFLTSIGA